MKDEEGTVQMASKRKFYIPEFTFKVVMESFRQDTTIVNVQVRWLMAALETSCVGDTPPRMTTIKGG